MADWKHNPRGIGPYIAPDAVTYAFTSIISLGDDDRKKLNERLVEFHADTRTPHRLEKALEEQSQ